MPGPSSAVMLASALQEFSAALPLMELAGAKPHAYMPALMTRKNDRWEVTIEGSSVYGQLSLLLGLSQLHAALAGKPTASEVRKALGRVFDVTVARHYDPQAKSFAGTHSPGKGMGNRLDAADAGFAMETLAFLAETLPASDALRASAVKHLDAQAAAVLALLLEGEVVPRTFPVGKGPADNRKPMDLSAQLALVNGLLAAGKVTGNAAYGKTADRLFAALRGHLWGEEAGLFRNAPGHTFVGYDGRLLGLNLSAWRHIGPRLVAGEASRSNK